ncbi:MAG: prephenate dehydrogenase [Gammaproteobacteria bacterium]
MFKSVYIYGLGMMGGSLAGAVKKSKMAQKIYAYDISKSNLSFAKKNKIIDNYDQDNFQYLSNADLIIICAPIGAYKKIFSNIKKYKKPDATITDIGSTKTEIIDIYKSIFTKNSNCFIGSHPLTGKESSTAKNSDASLFNGAVVLLTPISDDINLIKSISEFWRKLACKIFVLNAKQHDLVLSETSHLPHMVSFALVNIILNTKSIEKIGDFTGGGFRDFARLAHSDSTMWQDICLSNSKNIVKSINRLIKELDLIKSLINKQDKKLFKYLQNIKLKLEINDK